jgi:hypothetical protein
MDFFVPFFNALMFFLVKWVEMKYIDKEMKPMKYMVRDTIVVFMISCVSMYVYGTYFNLIQDFMSMMTSTKTVPTLVTPEIFTDNPGF